MTKSYSNECCIFRTSSFGIVSTFDIRTSSLAYRFGACINSTAIMLPRNTSSTMARPINIALRSGSFSSLCGRNGAAPENPLGGELFSASVASENGSFGMLPILLE